MTRDSITTSDVFDTVLFEDLAGVFLGLLRRVCVFEVSLKKVSQGVREQRCHLPCGHR